jgi:hypothetical protein
LAWAEGLHTAEALCLARDFLPTFLAVMSDDLDTPSLRRFAHDLRRIREDRDVTLAAIQEKTQVHFSHLESFETGTLHEEARMNDVYLKAFVRAYAEAVGLSPEKVVDHLESALSGTYDNQLATAFLDASPADGETVADQASDEEASNEENTTASERSPTPDDQSGARTPSTGDSLEPPPSGSTPPSDPGALKPQRSRSDDPETAPPDASSMSGDSSSGSAEGRPPQHSAPAETSHDERISDGHSRSAGRNSSPHNSGPPPPASPNPWAFVRTHRTTVLVVVGSALVLALGGVLGGYLTGEDPSPESASTRETSEGTPASDEAQPTTEAPSDTAGAEGEPRQPPPADITLGDTLHVTVRAMTDVRELRVQQDDNLRRPYWIEAGEARVFPFRERITLQNQLDSLRLLLEGHPYPTDRTDEQGRVVIRRDSAERFADTLRGTPPATSAVPDTIRGTGAGLVPDTLSSGSSVEP